MNLLRKYNTAATIVFPLYDPTGAALTTAATFAAGDVKIIKDEGASNNTTNLPAHEGNGLYSLVLTNTEMTAARVGILIDDQTSPELWLGIGISIDTYGNASAGIVFDLSQATPAADVTKWLGTAAATPTVAGVPEVDVTHWSGTTVPAPAVTGVPIVDLKYWVGDQTIAMGVSATPKVNLEYVDDNAIIASASGTVPADIRAINNNLTVPVWWDTLLQLAEVLTVTTASSNTTFSATAATATTDDNYIDRVGIFRQNTVTVALRGRPFYVTDYTGGSKTFVVDQLNASPAVGDVFILLP